MVFKIKLDTVACIGCVACTRCEPFVMGNDMKAHVVDALTDQPECVQAVAEECPVGAITVVKIT